jgi:predicted outer membrane repeat protein
MKGVGRLYLALFLLLVGRAQANVLRVPGDYSTVQAAIDDANDGDTVLVAPGTYTGDGNRDIYVRPKAITIKSEEGPQSCTINCGGSRFEPHVGFALGGDDAKGRSPLLEGFTITGAYGGVEGGGIRCSGGSPRIVNCRIIGNSARMGGGIACRYCSEVVITNCIISGNTAPSPDMAAKGISGSTGGLLIDASHATLTNCLITGNRTTETGGAIACGPISIVNCTISGNSGPTFGGIFGSGLLTMRNSIVCGNARMDIGSPDPHPAKSPSIRCLIEYSLVGIAASYCKPKGIECPPLEQLFVRTDYWDPNGTPDDPTDDFWVQGDYHLKSQAGRWDPVSRSWVRDDVTSPAVDAGDPNSPVGDEPFPNGGRINMGFYGGTAEASRSARRSSLVTSMATAKLISRTWLFLLSIGWPAPTQTLQNSIPGRQGSGLGKEERARHMLGNTC